MPILISNTGLNGRLKVSGNSTGGFKARYVVPSLLLDTYSGAAAAYSLRKLRAAYSGAAIRVRRSSDNTETDIGFVSNELDTTTLTSFCGAGNGFIVNWYDQSGNARNILQSTLGLQPQIINSGIINIENGKPAIIFNSDYLQSSLTIVMTPVTTFVVGKFTTSNVILGGGVGSYELRVNSSNKLEAVSTFVAFIAESANAIPNTLGLISTRFTSSGFYDFFRNNIDLGGAGNRGTGFSNVAFGLAVENGTASSGTFSEVIYYKADELANRTEISNNINSYYSIY